MQHVDDESYDSDDGHACSADLDDHGEAFLVWLFGYFENALALVPVTLQKSYSCPDSL